jgi:hypothetical protein
MEKPAIRLPPTPAKRHLSTDPNHAPSSLIDGAGWYLLAAAIVLAGAVVRVAASRGCLWLDEIWTLTRINESVSSAWDIFAGLHDSNNHHLNTLALYLLGKQQPWFVYRLPAVVAGIATILVAGHIGLRRGRLEALLAMLLTAGSYLLIYYSSEARGYGLVVFFNVLAFDLMEGFFDRPSPWVVAGFWGAAILGLLSQVLLWILFYVPLVAWSAVRALNRKHSWAQRARDLALWHALPIAAFVILDLVDLRKMALGEGPPYRLADVLLGAASLSVGGAEIGPGVIPCAAIMLVVLACGFWLLWKRRADVLIFYAGAIVVAPVGMAVLKSVVLLTSPDVLFIRYFVGAFAFFLVVAAFWLADLFRRGGRARIVAGVAITAFILGNVWQTAALLRYGRGDYPNALRYMAERTILPVVRVGSDHDFRNGLLIDFYARSVPDRKFRYYSPENVSPKAWADRGPQWYILHRWEEKPPPDGIQVRGALFIQRKRFRHAGASGWDWYVYQRIGPAASAP